MKFKIYDEKTKEAVKAYIDKLNPEKRYEVNISLKREIRTIPQNRLYWLYITCISDETGSSKDDVHSFIKQTYLRVDELVIGNSSIPQTVSTTKLNTKMMADLINQIVVWASSELGIILPDPADYLWDQFYEKYKDML